MPASMDNFFGNVHVASSIPGLGYLCLPDSVDIRIDDMHSPGGHQPMRRRDIAVVYLYLFATDPRTGIYTCLPFLRMVKLPADFAACCERQPLLPILAVNHD